MHSGKVEKGKLILDNPERWQVNLARFEGKPVELTLKQKRAVRSNNQNAYMWGVVIPILAETLGYSENEVHEVLKFEFLRVRLDNEFEYVRSTTSLNTKEMEEYLSKIRQWASMFHNCFIPDPNSMDF